MSKNKVKCQISVGDQQDMRTFQMAREIKSVSASIDFGPQSKDKFGRTKSFVVAQHLRALRREATRQRLLELEATRADRFADITRERTEHQIRSRVSRDVEAGIAATKARMAE